MAARRLQQLRRAARQPRGDDARHVRQHPPEEPAGARRRGRRDEASCRRASSMFIYDAAMKYQNEGMPLVVLAGAEYGTGSSRDWAAKGTMLLGVRAVIAKSFERIHRTNLVGMGVLPLQFRAGEDATTLGLTGNEMYSHRRHRRGPRPEQEAHRDSEERRRPHQELHRRLPHRYAQRARLLPARRHPAVRAAPAGEELRDQLRVLDEGHPVGSAFGPVPTSSRTALRCTKSTSELRVP